MPPNRILQPLRLPPVFPAGATPSTAQSYSGSPIHLTSTVTVTGSGQSAPTNAEALKNPLKEPMEIHAIKFQVSGTNVTGAAAGVKLSLGDIPLTKGFVPMWLFGRSNGNIASEITSAVSADYIWRLERPLYVPAGAIIKPEVQNFGVVAGAITVRVSLAGRSVPGLAKKTITAPYVLPWQSPFIVGVATATSNSSTETDLQNDLDVPLNVTTLNGRLSYSATLSDGSVQQMDAGFNELAQRIFKVQLFDSGGMPMIENPTIWANVFQWLNRSWTVNDQLAPGHFYVATISNDADATAYLLPINVLLNNSNTNIRGEIAVVGYREVQF